MSKSVFGLSENIAAALSNLTFGIFGVIVIILERDNKFVRFHGMQSIITFFGLAIVSGVVGMVEKLLGSIPVIGWITGFPLGILDCALWFITMIAWVYLSYSAYKGRMVKVPLVGDEVLRQLDK